MGSKAKQRKLPDTRESITHEFSVGGVRGYLTVGMFDDGTPGEVFINISKEGSTISGLLDTIAIAVSFALQYGVPLERLVNKFAYMRFEPSGFTGGDFGYAHSIVDYVFRWLGKRFTGKVPKEEKPIEEPLQKDETVEEIIETQVIKEEIKHEASPLEVENDLSAPACHNCGGITKRSGSCHVCLNCGETSGCS